MSDERKFLYGFANPNTGNFLASYRTIQGKCKPACFRTRANAEKLLKVQSYCDRYEVRKMVQIEAVER